MFIQRFEFRFRSFIPKKKILGSKVTHLWSFFAGRHQTINSYKHTNTTDPPINTPSRSKRGPELPPGPPLRDGDGIYIGVNKLPRRKELRLPPAFLFKRQNEALFRSIFFSCAARASDGFRQFPSQFGDQLPKRVRL